RRGLFIFQPSVANLLLHSFPTRRSSDLADQDDLSRARKLATAIIRGRSGSIGHGSRRSYREWAPRRAVSVCSMLWAACALARERSEEHTSELQSPCNLVCRLLLEKKKYI